jgi:CHAT domain-containing protein/lipoprotein NlpI
MSLTKLLIFCFAATLALAACSANQVREEQPSGSERLHSSQELLRPSIQNVAQMLREHRPSSERISQARAIFSAQPNAKLQGETLSDFYLERGLAAQSLGHLSEAEKDFRAANTLLEDKTNRRRVDALNFLFLVLQSQEQHDEANAVLDNIVEIWPDIPWSRAARVGRYASLGLKQKAQEELAAAELGFKRSEKGIAFFYALMRMNMEFARGLYKSRFESEEEGLVHLREALRLSKLIGILWKNNQKGFLPNATVLARSSVGAQIRLGDALLAQGQAGEAAFFFQSALLDDMSGQDGSLIAPTETISKLASALLQVGRLDEAELLALEISRTTSDSDSGVGKISLARAKKVLIEIYLARHEPKRALEVLVKSPLQRSTNMQIFVGEMDDTSVRVLLENGQIEDAISIALQCISNAKGAIAKVQDTTQRCQTLLEIARARSNPANINLDELTLYSKALKNRYRFTTEQRHPDFSEQRWSEFCAKAFLELLFKRYRNSSLENPDRATTLAEGFELAQLLNTSKTDASMRSALLRQRSDGPETATQTRRVQDMKLESIALSEAAVQLGRFNDQAKRQEAGQLRARATALDKERGDLERKLFATAPSAKNTATEQISSLIDFQNNLRPDEVAINTVVDEAQTYVWATGRDGLAQWYVVPIVREDLLANIEQLRASLDPLQWAQGKPPVYDEAKAWLLFKQLFGEAQSKLKAAKSLTFITYGPLAQVPFAALLYQEPIVSSETPWLIKRWAIGYATSVSSMRMARLTEPAKNHARGFVGFGDPIFDSIPATPTPPITQMVLRRASGMRISELPRLPDTAKEIQSLASLFKDNSGTQIYLDEQALRQNATQKNLENTRILAFATHGLAAGDVEGLSEPALALTRSKDSNDDGLLSAPQIMRLNLSAEWVLLSACNTADRDGIGAQAVHGLSSAFMYAGARAVLVTHWPIESSAARELTVSTLRHFVQTKGTTKAQSLQQAMIKMVDSNAFSHPFYWAAFSVIGD